MAFRKDLRKIKVLQYLASVRLTVVCLSLLFILTFWGTVAQVQNGLYLAQERFFHSFFFLVLGFIPFPGAQLVLWVLFVNLLSVALTRFVYQWKHIGILVIHLGLLLFLFSGFVTLHGTQESQLTLREGRAANVSNAYHDWEIAVWEQSPARSLQRIERDVTAVDTAELKPGQALDFKELGFTLTVKEYYRNCAAYRGAAGERDVRNASGIQKLAIEGLNKEPEKNIPGSILQVQADGKSFDVLLYGAESQPTLFQAKGKPYGMLLRRKRYPLPFLLRLEDFIMEIHPGTETARSYKSRVAINTADVAWREKLISMNNPLRYKEYTLYQASYSIDRMGNELSTLAVVKNSGRLLPYVSTFVTFFGLVIHFVMMAFKSKQARRV